MGTKDFHSNSTNQRGNILVFFAYAVTIFTVKLSIPSLFIAEIYTKKIDISILI